jgi:hypothetical protein
MVLRRLNAIATEARAPVTRRSAELGSGDATCDPVRVPADTLKKGDSPVEQLALPQLPSLLFGTTNVAVPPPLVNGVVAKEKNK